MLIFWVVVRLFRGFLDVFVFVIAMPGWKFGFVFFGDWYLARGVFLMQEKLIDFVEDWFWWNFFNSSGPGCLNLGYLLMCVLLIESGGSLFIDFTAEFGCVSHWNNNRKNLLEESSNFEQNNQICFKQSNYTKYPSLQCYQFRNYQSKIGKRTFTFNFKWESINFIHNLSNQP
jgi:hypothetical protein